MPTAPLPPGRDGRPAGSARRLRWAPVLLAAATATLYLAGLGAVGLYDPNEGMYAEIPREMLALGDWITPRFNFVRYFEKPPLLYWLTALAYLGLGVSEFAARLPTALAAIATVGLTGAIGRDLWGGRAGLVSALVLATSFGHFVFGRIVLTDMLFTALLAAAFRGFLRGLLEPAPGRWAVPGAWAALALAVLTKGLIGLVFPVAAVGGLLVLTGDRTLATRLQPGRGLLIFLAVAAPWHLAAAAGNPDFLWFYFVNEHLLRFVGRRHLVDYAPLPLPVFLLMVAVWAFPWSAFVPAAVVRYWPGRRPAAAADRGFLLVLLWAVAVVGFFALTPSRLEYYSMPAFPALALCAGRLWADETGAGATGDRRLGWSCLALLALALALPPAAWLFPRLEGASVYNMLTAVDAYSRDIQSGILSGATTYPAPSYAELRPGLLAAALVVALAVTLATAAWFGRRPRLALASLALGMLPALGLVQLGLVLFEPHRSVVRLATVIRAEHAPGDQVVIEGPYENFAAADFYTGVPARVLNGRFGDLVFGAGDPEARDLFLDEAGFARLWQGPGRVFLLTDVAGGADRLRHLSPPPVVLGRTGKNWLFSNRPRGADRGRPAPPAGGPGQGRLE